MKHATTVLLCGWILWMGQHIPATNIPGEGRVAAKKPVAIDAFETKNQCWREVGARRAEDKRWRDIVLRCWPAGHTP